MPDVWLSQSSETVGTLSIIQIFFLLSTHHELGFVVESAGLEFGDGELEGVDLLASSALLDFESSADLEAASFDSLSDFTTESDAALLADVASNCRTVSTIFVPLTLNV